MVDVSRMWLFGISQEIDYKTPLNAFIFYYICGAMVVVFGDNVVVVMHL